MPLLVWILLFASFGGIASAAFAGLYLLVPERLGRRLLPHFVSFATGALIGAALLGLLPESIRGAGPTGARRVGAALVVGLGVFFVIEKLVLWRHVHHAGGHATATGSRGSVDGHGVGADGHTHPRDAAAGVLVLVGDSIHNALDGVLIAAAFLTSVPLGLVTSFAVAAHEIPHRVGDFALLLNAGMSRRRALVLNMATGTGSLLGGLLAYFGLQRAAGVLPYALALAAAGFLYIAVAGLIPGLQRSADPRTSLTQVLFMALGVLVIAAAEALVGG